MNYLLISVLVLCAGCMIYGYIRGFIKIVVSLVATIAVAVLVGMFVPKVTDLIIDYTPLDDAIELQFTTAMFGDSVYLAEGDISESLSLVEEISLIESADIPDFLKEATLDNNNDEIYEQLGVTTFAEYIGKYLSTWIIKVLAYIVTFLIVLCLVNVFIYSLDVIAGLPVLDGINRVVGIFLGLGMALIVTWVGFLGITIMYSSDFGKICFAWIEGNAFLSLLYNLNPIINMLL